LRRAASPYGEALVDEHATTYENPFKFSGKELDDITGLYDHGARSRDPKVTMWYGVDPLYEKYPDFSPYSYCMCNPVRFVDPDGRGVYGHRNEDGSMSYMLVDESNKKNEKYLIKDENENYVYFEMDGCRYKKIDDSFECMDDNGNPKELKTYDQNYGMMSSGCNTNESGVRTSAEKNGLPLDTKEMPTAADMEILNRFFEFFKKSVDLEVPNQDVLSRMTRIYPTICGGGMDGGGCGFVYDTKNRIEWLPTGWYYGKGDTMSVKRVNNVYMNGNLIKSDTVYVRYNPKKRK